MAAGLGARLSPNARPSSSPFSSWGSRSSLRSCAVPDARTRPRKTKRAPVAGIRAMMSGARRCFRRCRQRHRCEQQRREPAIQGRMRRLLSVLAARHNLSGHAGWPQVDTAGLVLYDNQAKSLGDARRYLGVQPPGCRGALPLAAPLRPTPTPLAHAAPCTPLRSRLLPLASTRSASKRRAARQQARWPPRALAQPAPPPPPPAPQTPRRGR
jgi:hypothetical protein